MNDKELQNTIVAYAYDTDNPYVNFNLASLYDSIGHTAAAISFYLRAADILGKSDNEIEMGVVYECMIRIAMAFAKQGGRGNSQQGALKHAIRIDPNRPEAYYHLSQYYESIKKYMDSYLAAEAGLRCDDTSAAPHLGYPGVYALIFQKAVAAWWWGRPKETRELHNLLANEYRDVMDDTHKKIVQSNLSSLGLGPEAQAFRTYLKGKHKLRKQFQFDWTADIERNNSQAYQDMFVLTALDGKRNGTYLELGSADAFKGNNTALLELPFDWTGVGIDYNRDFVSEYNSRRKNKSVVADATKVDYTAVLESVPYRNARTETCPFDGRPKKVIDYLQVDCEPPGVTFEALLSIPFYKYMFATITYEHDYYADVTKSYREKSRRYLKSIGYVLVVPDVSVDGVSNFEDWWVHPSLISPERIDLLKSSVSGGQMESGIVNIEKYFLEQD